MIINVANFNFDGGSGGGGKPALLQEKTATIVQNGSQTITPDEGFDGMSSVQINAAITGASSAIDFSPIGYDAELSAEVNSNINDDVAYSKTLYDAWDPSRTSAFRLYYNDKKLKYAPYIDTSNVTNMVYMFQGCSSLTTVPLYNTSNVTDMNNMFVSCKSITSVPLFDTSKVTDMYGMFIGCSGLKTVPLFDTSNVTRMQSMFDGCSGITKIPAFNTSKVTDMVNMLSGCKSITSVPLFDTSKVTDMYGMFNGCSGLTTVPEMDTSNATRMQLMFQDCSRLTTIEGISFKSFADSTMDYSYIAGFYDNTSIRKAIFKDIGYQSSAVQFNTSKLLNWGVNTDEIPDARQSLIDSLITYSFDRASAGYPTCKISLSYTTKQLLTEDEKSQIIAKGYTI